MIPGAYAGHVIDNAGHVSSEVGTQYLHGAEIHFLALVIDFLKFGHELMGAFVMSQQGFESRILVL